MLTEKKWTEELELRQELRNLIWFYPHSYWLHLSVTGRKQTCWMPASPCLSIATVRHLDRRGELFPTGKCDQRYHHSCRLVGQSGSRLWWLGEWLASTWKFSADRINLFLLPLPSWLFLPWFRIFFLLFEIMGRNSSYQEQTFSHIEQISNQPSLLLSITLLPSPSSFCQYPSVKRVCDRETEETEQ